MTRSGNPPGMIRIITTLVASLVLAFTVSGADTNAPAPSRKASAFYSPGDLGTDTNCPSLKITDGDNTWFYFGFATNALMLPINAKLTLTVEPYVIKEGTNWIVTFPSEIDPSKRPIETGKAQALSEQMFNYGAAYGAGVGRANPDMDDPNAIAAAARKKFMADAARGK